MTYSENITRQHQELKAIIYVRQSSLGQVKNNVESREVQYALRERAIQFGWSEDRVEVLETDQGITGTNIEDREGIQYLMSQVGMAQVGIIFCYDVSRLMRNCSEWYNLLDICAFRKALIGDKEGVYDPRTPTGRMILGLKGQFAEMEQNTIRARMSAGLLNKAKRGDLILSLPIGLVSIQRGIVTKDPNIEVQNCIKNIFELFLKLKSGGKVFRFFKDNNLKIPRYIANELTWKKPTRPAIIAVLKNPAYAGANVYGKTETIFDDINPKKKRIKSISMDKWKFIVKDKFPPYISWETFEKIQSMLRENYAEYSNNKTRGIPRSGEALLHGLMYCGCCAHKMTVRYKSGARYLCEASRCRSGAPICQNVPSDPINEYVVEAFFQALSPIELNAYEKMVEEEWYEVSAVNKMKEQEIERLDYQAKLAERQFNQVDPDNRLVAAELEKRWENALKVLSEAKSDRRHEIVKHENKLSRLPMDLKNAFIDLGKKLPNAWKDLQSEHKKSFLRCLIDKVVVHRKERNSLQVRIVWIGGETTTKEMSIPINRFEELPFAKELEKKIVELAKLDVNDETIATDLTKAGYHSAASPQLLVDTVKKVRLKHGIVRGVPRGKALLHSIGESGFITASQLSARLNISSHWIYNQINKGKINIKKDPSTGSYLFPNNPETDKMMIELRNKKHKVQNS